MFFSLFLMFLIASPSYTTALEHDSKRPPVTVSPLKRPRTLESASEGRETEPLCADGSHGSCTAAGSPRVRVGYHVSSPKTDDPTFNHFLRATDDQTCALEADINTAVNFAFARFLLQKPDGDHRMCALVFSTTPGIVSIVPRDDARTPIQRSEIFTSDQKRDALVTTLHLAQLLSSLQKNKDPASFYNTQIAGKFSNRKTDMVKKIIDLYAEYMKSKDPKILSNIQSTFGEARDEKNEKLATLLHSINGSGCAEQQWARAVLGGEIQIPEDLQAFLPNVTSITTYMGSKWSPCIACGSLMEHGLIYDAINKLLSRLKFMAERPHFVFTALYPYHIEARTSRGQVQTPAYPNHDQDMSGMWELRIARAKWEEEKDTKPSPYGTTQRADRTTRKILGDVTNHPPLRTTVYPSPGDAAKAAAKQTQLEADAADSDATSVEDTAAVCQLFA